MACDPKTLPPGQEERDPSKVAGIILGAGASSRMGSPKQLLTTGGETLLYRVLRTALDSILDPVVLVVGFQAEKILDSLGRLTGHPKLLPVRNPRFREGMSTSLISGLCAVEDIRESIMVLLGDMPHVTVDLIKHLWEATSGSGFPLGAVKVRGRRTLPAVIGRELYAEVKKLEGDVGARGIFRNHPDQVCLVEPPSEYDDSDIDTPEEFQRFQEAVQKGFNESKEGLP